MSWRFCRRPEVKTRFAAQFVLPRADTPEEFDRIIRDETAQLTEVFKDFTQ